MLAAALLLAAAATVRAQHVTSTATCDPSFSWMNNQEGQSPCLVAAYLQAPCSSDGSFTQVSIAGLHVAYSAPNATYQSGCSCSWAVYNLIAACTACQNGNQYLGWQVYHSQCTPANSQTGTYYPAFDFSNATSLQFWATTDPTTWPSTIFNVAQAEGIAQQGHADIFSASRNNNGGGKKKSSAGAIAGGVVGGLAALLLGLLAVLFVLQRRRRAALVPRPSLPHNPSSFASSVAKYGELPPVGQMMYQPTGDSVPTTLAPTVAPSLAGSGSVGQFQVSPLILPAPERTPSPPTSHGRQFSTDSKVAPSHGRMLSMDSTITDMSAVVVAPSAQYRNRFNPPAYEPTESGTSSTGAPRAPGPRRADTIAEDDDGEQLPSWSGASVSGAPARSLQLHNADGESSAMPAGDVKRAPGSESAGEGLTAQGFPDEKRRPM